MYLNILDIFLKNPLKNKNAKRRAITRIAKKMHWDRKENRPTTLTWGFH